MAFGESFLRTKPRQPADRSHQIVQQWIDQRSATKWKCRRYDDDVHCLQYYLICFFGRGNAEDFDISTAIKSDQFVNNPKEDAAEVDTPLSSVSIEVRPLCNLQFADDIDLLGGSEEEFQQQLTERLEKTVADYGTEISSDKSKTS